MTVWPSSAWETALRGGVAGRVLLSGQPRPQPDSWAGGRPWEQPGQEPFCLFCWSLEKSTHSGCAWGPLSLLVSTEEPLWPVTGRSHRHVTKAAGGSQKADVMFYKKKAPEPGLNAQFGGFSTPLALLSLLPSPLLPRPLLEWRETLGEE